MRIKIFPKNLEILKNINQENKIPITSLVNSYIYEQLNEKSDLLKEFKSKLAKEQTEVKIRIYENEKKFLLESSKLTGTNSLNQEIRFRLLNPDFAIGYSWYKLIL